MTSPPHVAIPVTFTVAESFGRQICADVMPDSHSPSWPRAKSNSVARQRRRRTRVGDERVEARVAETERSQVQAALEELSGRKRLADRRLGDRVPWRGDRDVSFAAAPDVVGIGGFEVTAVDALGDRVRVQRAGRVVAFPLVDVDRADVCRRW